MAIAVDWPNKAITINQSDCTLVSGTFYTLDVSTVVWPALIALEDDEDGIVWPDTLINTSPLTIAGTTLARGLEITNGYTVEFLPDAQWTVQLDAANSNIWSVGDGILVQNQVQVIPTNSAGLVVYQSGSGLTTPQADDLELVRKLMTNRRELSDGNSGNLVYYDDDDVATLLTHDVTDESDGNITLGPGDPAKQSKGA